MRRICLALRGLWQHLRRWRQWRPGRWPRGHRRFASPASGARLASERVACLPLLPVPAFGDGRRCSQTHCVAADMFEPTALRNADLRGLMPLAVRTCERDGTLVGARDDDADPLPALFPIMGIPRRKTAPALRAHPASVINPRTQPSHLNVVPLCTALLSARRPTLLVSRASPRVCRIIPPNPQ